MNLAYLWGGPSPGGLGGCEELATTTQPWACYMFSCRNGLTISGVISLFFMFLGEAASFWWELPTTEDPIHTHIHTHIHTCCLTGSQVYTGGCRSYCCFHIHIQGILQEELSHSSSATNQEIHQHLASCIHPPGFTTHKESSAGDGVVWVWLISRASPLNLKLFF